MLAFDWLEQTDNIAQWVQYFACENDLCRAMLPDCLGTLSSTLCQIAALKEALTRRKRVCFWDTRFWAGHFAALSTPTLPRRAYAGEATFPTFIGSNYL